MFIKGLKYFRWMRNYKIWFVLFFIILFFQVYLASRFLTLSKSIARSDLQNTIDVDDSDNSARKARPADDDEDTQASTTKTNNAKKLKSNATIHLRLEELDFTPACVIDNKEAVSAIYRAKTQTCKQLLANITCLSNADKLYPAELKGNCPADGFVFRKDLGCFKDEKEFRILSGYFGVNKKDNSPLYCIKLCLQSGFIYAGVQYSDECFCGNDEPPSTSKMPDSSCNMKCPGDGHATCGGYYTINVYQTGIKKFTPQVANTEIASTAPRVKIVFLLTLNGRAVRQVLRLIKNLYHKDHYYYIHVDIRQDYMFRELLKLEKLLPNVRLTRNRFATIWGGASLLRMLRSCMSELLTQPAWKWDFVLNLSESDFPVKTIAQLTDFLTANRDRNFVKSHGREVQRFIQKQGLDKTFVECETRMWRIGDRRLPLGVQLDGGSDWVALSYKFVQYVAADRPDSLISGLLLIFNHTLLPAESFFHTVLRNSKFCGSYVDNNLHVTNWKRKLGCKCQYKHIVDWCGCSPNDFKVEDWLRIQNTQTRQLYFARKFEPVISQAVILRLELWIRGLEKPPRLVENLDAYWQNLYHIKDLGESVDDGLLTLANSIQRRVAKLLRNDSCSQGGAIGPVLQITSYHLKDNSKYTLFLIKTPEVNIEVAVKPINHLLALHPSGLVKSLETFIVSSNYDQKEQLCRNFVRILSPYSEPTLMYRFGASFGGKAFNLTGLWIDPSGLLQDVTFSFVDENNLQGFAKAGLRPPLLPGNWTIKLLHKSTLLLQTSFLIIPLEFIGGSAISEIQAQLLHQPSEMHQHRKDYSNFLPNADEKQTLQNVAKSNANRYGVDLRDWIDSLTMKFYSVRKICGHFSEAVSLCGKTLEACVRSNWSSLAPDPKSAITLEQINSTTGMFDVW